MIRKYHLHQFKIIKVHTFCLEMAQNLANRYLKSQFNNLRRHHLNNGGVFSCRGQTQIFLFALILNKKTKQNGFFKFLQ